MTTDYMVIIRDVANYPEVTNTEEYLYILSDRLSDIGVNIRNPIIKKAVDVGNPF